MSDDDYLDIIVCLVLAHHYIVRVVSCHASTDFTGGRRRYLHIIRTFLKTESIYHLGFFFTSISEIAASATVQAATKKNKAIIFDI